jgi:hypothetical protein
VLNGDAVWVMGALRGRAPVEGVAEELPLCVDSFLLHDLLKAASLERGGDFPLISNQLGIKRRGVL